MYNGVGLATARGSGTNAYVQRNLSQVRSVKEKPGYKTEREIQNDRDRLDRKPNAEILLHDKKRRVELKCMELQNVMEEQGYDDEEIEKKVSAFRKMLIEKEEKLPGREDSSGRPVVNETHQIAEMKEQENEKLRNAFGISKSYVQGAAFDPEARKLQRQREAEERDAERQKRYEIVRTPSPLPFEEDRSEIRKKKSEKKRKKSRRKKPSSSSDSEDAKKKKKKKRAKSSSDESTSDESDVDSRRTKQRRKDGQRDHAVEKLKNDIRSRREGGKERRDNHSQRLSREHHDNGNHGHSEHYQRDREPSPKNRSRHNRKTDETRRSRSPKPNARRNKVLRESEQLKGHKMKEKSPREKKTRDRRQVSSGDESVPGRRHDSSSSSENDKGLQGKTKRRVESHQTSDSEESNEEVVQQSSHSRHDRKHRDYDDSRHLSTLTAREILKHSDRDRYPSPKRRSSPSRTTTKSQRGYLTERSRVDVQERVQRQRQSHSPVYEDRRSGQNKSHRQVSRERHSNTPSKSRRSYPAEQNMHDVIERAQRQRRPHSPEYEDRQSSSSRHHRQGLREKRSVTPTKIKRSHSQERNKPDVKERSKQQRWSRSPDDEGHRNLRRDGNALKRRHQSPVSKRKIGRTEDSRVDHRDLKNKTREVEKARKRKYSSSDSSEDEIRKQKFVRKIHVKDSRSSTDDSQGEESTDSNNSVPRGMVRSKVSLIHRRHHASSSEDDSSDEDDKPSNRRKIINASSSDSSSSAQSDVGTSDSSSDSSNESSSSKEKPTAKRRRR